MSHIGKKPIEIPEKVQIKISGQKVTATGPMGELSREIRPEIKTEKKGNQLIVFSKVKTKKSNAFWGMERALLNNMVKGVKEGFEKKLTIEGVGYKGNIENGKLILQVGFSHQVEITPLEGIEISVKGKTIIVSGMDKAKVGQVASQIRKVRPPDPYKGKGIRYEGEEIKLKPGKKAIGIE